MQNTSPSKFEKSLLVRTHHNPVTDDKVGVRKPQNDRPVRVHPDLAMSPTVYLMMRKSTGDPPMLVIPDVAAQVPDEPTIAPYRLYLCKDSLGKVFFWPVKDTASTGSWQKSAHQLAEHARDRWIRVAASIPNNRYEEAPCNAPSTEVSWPEVSVFKLLEEAFGDDVIEQVDDGRITGLRGGGTLPQ
jgi:hypothetical protein